MKEKVYNLMLLTFIGLLISCGQNKNQTISDNSQKYVQTETITKSPQIFGIKGKDIVIRVGPGETFDKLINKKATEVLGETDYAQVDYSVKVIIEEQEGDWSKIKVVEPDWLSNSHVGWIPTQSIINGRMDDIGTLEKLDPLTYEILKIENNATVQNFHVLIKFSDFDQDKIFDFIKKFRNEHCTNRCNIMIYDTKSILALIDKNPLQGKEYIQLADHFVSMSTFDASDLRLWYPYQDIQYKEYGGKNWKKEEIK